MNEEAQHTKNFTDVQARKKISQKTPKARPPGNGKPPESTTGGEEAGVWQREEIIRGRLRG